MAEETFSSRGFVGADFEEVVDDGSCRELGLGQSVVSMMKEAEVTVASLDGGARALEELSALFDGVGDQKPIIIAKIGF